MEIIQDLGYSSIFDSKEKFVEFLDEYNEKMESNAETKELINKELTESTLDLLFILLSLNIQNKNQKELFLSSSIYFNLFS